MRNRMRHIRTTQERREGQEGWSRPCRNMKNLPEYRDEFWVRPQRSWKEHRKHQWKVMSVPNRQNLLRRNPYCSYCERQVDVCTGTLDHRLPKCKGGGSNNNLVLACKKCNSIKGCMLPEEWDKLLPVLREAGYFFMSKRQRRLWRQKNPGILHYASVVESSQVA